ncbi:Na+/H+ antiporter [Agromyces sp. Soil535]|uniref:Na+/H+ antiporter n=1 Tax=Agromyces sp. Soil535 TaxID=1736390 RepID=UPI000A5AFB11|nr:Na+/H+ antiporter [Agromyces sp. Soil535]
MLGLELVVVLAVALIACSVLARRLRIAPAVLLLVTGILLGLLPALHEVRLPPEVVLLLFLPALLFWESLTTSLQGIRRDLRGIILTSTVLVVLTAAAVAAVAHAFGVPWGVAWVLGAALAPTDATAVAAFARSMPRRNVTILKAESLINDGTALVIYGIAVGVTVGEQEVTALGITGEFLLSYLGGAAAGAVIAAAGLFVLRRLDDPILKNVALILIPFGSYLLAELVRASGVLAVVVAGLITTQVGPRVSSATSRRQSESFWSLATFILNGSLFVLVGLEVSTAVRSLPPAEIGIALVMAVVVWLVILAVGYAFLFGAVALIRLLDRRPSQRARRMGYRTRIVGGMAGFRGAVSLAAALAVPRRCPRAMPSPTGTSSSS